MSKIIKLQAENVKRLKAIEITPDGNMVIITGKNAQGKSSILDSIWYCLAGESAQKKTSRPIRDGERSANVQIETEDLIIRRDWISNEKSYLTVTTKEGAKYPSPQSILNKLVGDLSFDPLEFAKMESKKRYETLLGLVNLEIDLDQLEAEKKFTYDTRTTVNKELKKLQMQLDTLSTPENNLPENEIEIKDLQEELKSAYAVINENRKKRMNLDNWKQVDQKAIESKIDKLKRDIQQLQNDLAIAESEQIKIRDRIKKEELAIKKLVDPKVSDIENRIAESDKLNKAIRLRNAYSMVENALGDARIQADSLTVELEELEKKKVTAIQSATFPIDGLGFNDSGVTFNGIPFDQCSSAEQLKISLSIAMALNPKLRVIRITDGSLLDYDNLQTIKEMAKEKDFQIWLEAVQSTDELALVIEDGMIK